MSKKRIFISDNSRDFVSLLVDFFSKQLRIEIVGVAYDGKQTLEAIAKAKPDVLLLDLVMPEMDGIEILKKIYENGDKIKVYIISALEDESIHERIKEYGVERYFIKPVNFNEILHAIL